MSESLAAKDPGSKQLRSRCSPPAAWLLCRPARLALALLLLLAIACSGAAPRATRAPTAPPRPLLTPTSAPPAGPLSELQAVSTATARQGMVVGTMAPDAVSAGMQIMQKGGSAADAALATALAQVPLLPGNFITYAGIMEFLYYDAESGKVYSLNAGWNVPRGETDPLSIPATETPFTGNFQPSGRTALVPGFMAGLEAAHDRFGRLPFPALFEPAITFARQGVRLDEMQAGFIAAFEPVLTRLPETAALFRREDGRLYQTGDHYRQPELAATLKQIARSGSVYMYSGAWGQKFVETIQREGGTITADDMAAYEPLWTEPVRTDYNGYDIYSAGLPGFGGVNLVEAFNLLEAARLDEYAHFAQDPESLFWMMQISRARLLTSLDSEQQAALFPGQDMSLEAREGKESAARLWSRIHAGRLPFFAPIQGTQNSHSAAVVAVDRWGNIAAMTHTSNAYLYGGSGITVDGVYIPDPGSYQQPLILRTGPGRRLPNPINPAIILRAGRPVWASACIGNVHDETFQRLASVLAFGLNLQQAQQAPTILAPRFEDGTQLPTGQFFRGEFDRQLLQAVQDLGQPVIEISVDFDNFAMNRGVLAAIAIDPDMGTLTGSVPAVLGGFAAGYGE